MKLTPFADKIVVRKLDPPKRLIIDPHEEDRIPSKGVVIAYNTEMNPNPFALAGEVVIFGAHVGERLPGTMNLFVIMEADIWCKVDGDLKDLDKQVKGDM